MLPVLSDAYLEFVKNTLKMIKKTVIKLFLISSFAVMCYIKVQAQYKISTVVGFSTEGRHYSEVILSFPEDMAIDGNGNIYIVERSGSRVKKINASDGSIFTIVGTGVSGYEGDGGQAKDAQLSLPSSIALDNSGNLYITDDGNHRIRKVDLTTGIITTIAGTGNAGFSGDGGLAIDATLNRPYNMAFDKGGDLIFADRDNHRIRKINLNSGVITTIAGTGNAGFSGDGGLAANAEFDFPTDIDFDSVGNIYIVDSFNHRIRKIDQVTGIISTVAGSGLAGINNGGYSGDGSLATLAQLKNPLDLAIDASDNIYITDALNNSLRKVTASTGIITTIDSTINLYGVTIDNANNVYYSSGGILKKYETLNSQITKLNANGMGVNFSAGYSGDNIPANMASLSGPTGIAIDKQGNLYISDFRNHRIRKVTASTGIITTVAGNGQEGFSGDGGLATNAKLNDPIEVGVDGVGNVYFVDFSNYRVRKVDATTGIITTIAGTGVKGYSGDGGLATAAQIERCIGLDVDDAGNVYFADAHRVRKIDATTGIITTIAGTGIRGYSGDGGLATAAQIDWPNDVALDSAGNIYIADQDRVVRKVDAKTGIITTAMDTDFWGLTGLALDKEGNIYVSSVTADYLRKINVKAKNITNIAGTGKFGFGGENVLATKAVIHAPRGVVVDAQGNVYFADSNNNRIAKLDPSSFPEVAVQLGTNILAINDTIVFDVETKKISLKNIGGGDLSIESFELSDNDYSLSNNSTVVLKPNEIQEFDIKLDKLLSKDELTTLTIKSNDLDEGEFKVYLKTTITSPITNITELFPKNELIVFPNPVEKHFIVRSKGKVSLRKARLKIYDVQGKLVAEMKGNTDSQQELKYNIEHLPKGHYLLKIMTDSQVFERKIIKK